MSQWKFDSPDDNSGTCYDDRYGPLTAALNDLVEQYRSHHSAAPPSLEDYLVAARRLVLEGHDPVTVTVAAMGSVAIHFGAELLRWQSKVANGSGDGYSWGEGT